MACPHNESRSFFIIVRKNGALFLFVRSFLYFCREIWISNGEALDTAACNGDALDTAACNGEALDTAACNGEALDTAACNGEALDTAACNGEALDTAAIKTGNRQMENKEQQAEGSKEPFWRETIHNQHRRSLWHDYCEKGLYMVTMVIEGRKRLFGALVGHAAGRPGTDEAPHIALSELGRRVLEHEVPKISRYYPMVEVWRVAMMPDHIHLLLYVREPLPEGKYLGQVVRGFKTGCSRAWWQWQDEMALGGKAPSTTAPKSGAPSTTAAVPQALSTTAPKSGAPSTMAVVHKALSATAAVPQALSAIAAVPKASPLGKEQLRPVLFQKGYHDRIINKPGMLENIKRYMEENPLRARIREECPRLMERQLHLWIGGREYAAFGNLFLLKYPIKEQVFFHRKDPTTGLPTETTETYRQEHTRLLRIAEEGTVLITPGISKGESLVVNDALDARLPLILVQKEPMGEYWKPAQRRFYACAAGHLLILAPWQVEGTSDYARFHHLNDLVREICETAEMRILDYSKLYRQ